MKKYLIKYSYMPDDGVPMIKIDYAMLTPNQQKRRNKYL